MLDKGHIGEGNGEKIQEEKGQEVEEGMIFEENENRLFHCLKQKQKHYVRKGKNGVMTHLTARNKVMSGFQISSQNRKRNGKNETKDKE